MAGARALLAGVVGAVFDSDSENDEEEQPGEVVPFRINDISDRVLFQRTRLDRRVFGYVLNLISASLTKNTRKGRYMHLTPMHKLYVALQFYASGSFQWLVGSSGKVSQSMVSSIITDVTNALVEISPQFIRFPTAAEYPRVKQQFHQIGERAHGRGMPNVLGVIDCTHCRLKAPTNAPEQYFNRHLYHSINVQLIAGPDLKIYNAFAEYPGSNHDSYIWRNSAVREALAGGNFVDGWLLGDSGYPQEAWLMTPVANLTSPADHLYNSVHISTRNVIERVNGVLKSRWHVLDSQLGYVPGKVCAIITACCVLHNICTDYNLDIEDFQHHPLNDDVNNNDNLNQDFFEVRRNLIANHFTQ